MAIKLQFTFRSVLAFAVAAFIIYHFFIKKREAGSEGFGYIMYPQVGEKGPFCVPGTTDQCSTNMFCNASHRCEKVKKMNGFCNANEDCMNTKFWNSNPYAYFKENELEKYKQTRLQ